MLAYATAMIFSFIAHRKYTFRSKQDIFREYLRFTLMTALTFAATVLIMEYVVHGLRQSYLLGIVLVDIIVPAISFIVMLFYVFGNRDRQPEATSPKG
jgi:putative flippase GtrA